MTREEAINFGEMWLDINEDDQNSQTYAFFERALEVLKAEPCEDAVSREAVMQTLYDYGCESEIQDAVADLPPVTPKRKTGHWIMTSDYLTTAYGSIDYVKCSCCGEDSLEEGDYCPNCGEKMVEPQESEE